MIWRRVLLAWHNLTHDLRRLALALGGIAFAVLLMCLQIGFRNALFDSSVELLRHLRGELALTSRASYALAYREPLPRERLYQARQAPGVQAVAPLYIEIPRALWRHPQTGVGVPIRVLAVDVENPALDLPEIAAQAAALQLPGRVLADSLSKHEYGPLHPGVRSELSGRQAEIAGLFRLGTDFANDGNLLTSSLNYRQFFPLPGGLDPLAQVDLATVVLEPQADPRTVQAALQAALPADVVVLTREELVARELNFWRTSTPIGVVFTLGAVMGFVVGTIICYQILYSDIADHLHEFATLKAMGYRDRYFVGLVLQESLLLSLLGFVPGVGVSWGLYELLGALTGLPMQLTLPRAGLILGLTALMCVCSGLFAMRKLVGNDPAELF